MPMIEARTTGHETGSSVTPMPIAMIDSLSPR